MIEFPTLPRELQYSVLGCINVQESHKLLKVTKSLRRQVLVNGAFPRKVELLEFTNFDNLSGSETFRLKVQTKGTSVGLKVSEGFLNIDNHSIATKSPWLLTKNIEATKSITLNYREFDFPLNMHKLNAIFCNFLPKKRFSASFSLSLPIFSAYELCSDKFELFISHSFLIDLKKSKFRKFENDFYEKTFGFYVGEFTEKFIAKMGFEKTKCFITKNPIKYHYHALEKTKIQKFFVLNANLRHFEDSLTFILDNGIPSKYEKSMAFLHANVNLSQSSAYLNSDLGKFFRLLFWDLENMKGIEKITRETIEGRLLEAFFERELREQHTNLNVFNANEANYGLNSDYDLQMIYKKRLPFDKICVYMATVKEIRPRVCDVQLFVKYF